MTKPILTMILGAACASAWWSYSVFDAEAKRGIAVVATLLSIVAVAIIAWESCKVEE